MLESYSAPARRAVVLASAEARQLDHPRVGTEHLLLGLLVNDDDVAASALGAAGASVGAARHKVAEATGSAGDGDGSDGGDPQYTPRARRAIERAGRFARQDRAPAVQPAHLLLGVLDVEGLACQVLRGLGVDVVRLRAALVEQPVDVMVALDEPPPRDAVPPRCPTCAAVLDDTLAVTPIEARTDDAATATVHVVYCAACGTSIGTLPPSA